MLVVVLKYTMIKFKRILIFGCSTHILSKGSILDDRPRNDLYMIGKWTFLVVGLGMTFTWLVSEVVGLGMTSTWSVSKRPMCSTYERSTNYGSQSKKQFLMAFNRYIDISVWLRDIKIEWPRSPSKLSFNLIIIEFKPRIPRS